MLLILCAKSIKALLCYVAFKLSVEERTRGINKVTLMDATQGWYLAQRYDECWMTCSSSCTSDLLAIVYAKHS